MCLGSEQSFWDIVISSNNRSEYDNIKKLKKEKMNVIVRYLLGLPNQVVDAATDFIVPASPQYA